VQPAALSETESAEKSIANASTGAPTPFSSSNTPAPSQSPVKPASPSASPKSPCSTDNASIESEYTSEMKKARSDLNDKLTFIALPDSIAQSVDNYNATALDLFNEYSAKAKAANCSFTQPKPTPLPQNYYP
jgi:hypothetical protein